MASFVTPKKNTAYTFYVSLTRQDNTMLAKANPTLATGDCKVSIDGGTLNNLGTLPVVAPAGGSLVRVVMATAEMNGDNIIVAFSDAAGAEWCDLTVNIQTTAQQIDDLAPASTALSTATWTNARSGYLDVLNGILAAIWAYATRTLTQTGAQVAAAVDGSDLVITKYVTFDATLTGLSLTGTPVYWMVKQHVEDADNDALIAISSVTGLTRINKRAAVTAGNGSITVSGSSLIIHLEEAETSKLPAGAWLYSVKRINAGDTFAVSDGNATVQDTLIKAVS